MKPRRTPPAPVRIDRGALADAESLADAALPQETGGILLGDRADGVVVVRRFLEVPDEAAGTTRYQRQHGPAQEALDRILGLEPPDSLLGYVGEWHSHPGPAGPSRQDVKELRASARRLKHPVALVALCREQGSWGPRAWTAHGRRARATTVIESDEADSVEEGDQHHEP